MTLTETAGLGSTTLPVLEIALRMLLATFFGAIVGLERELRGHSAGLRTHMLTALAASMFTILTFEIFHQVRQIDNSPNVDPLRLIEAVTAGVSFLAAGTIIHGSGKVQGLTTGAGIWLAGAVGVASGSGFYAIALMGTVLAVVIVVLLRGVERHLLDTKEPKSAGDGDNDN